MVYLHANDHPAGSQATQAGILSNVFWKGYSLAGTGYLHRRRSSLLGRCQSDALSDNMCLDNTITFSPISDHFGQKKNQREVNMLVQAGIGSHSHLLPSTRTARASHSQQALCPHDKLKHLRIPAKIHFGLPPLHGLILRHCQKELILLFACPCHRRFKQLLLGVTARFTLLPALLGKLGSTTCSWMCS